MVYAEYSFRNVFQYEDGDVYWCRYRLDYGAPTLFMALLAGATTIMFEGIPSYPDAGRFWDIVDRFQVNMFYTARQLFVLYKPRD